MLTRILNFQYFKRCHSSVVPLEQMKSSPKGNTRKYIADQVRIHIRGGSGGQGSPSAGGIGGKGGSVFVKCVQGSSLSRYALHHSRRITAGHGCHYVKGALKVASGKDVYITIPPGTEIKSADNVLLCDMNENGKVMKLANGGPGGSAKTTDFNGEKGERKNIILEVKSIADVGLTGFPNAGKSSLLRAVSRATPKVGKYSFTTINPMVGSIFYSDSQQVKVADIPGLIEHAHLNKGMGHKFLRHIERTKLVLLVIDIDGFQLAIGHPYRSPLDTIILLLKELALYQEVIFARPFLLVLNKMDKANSVEKRERVLQELLTVDSTHYLLKDFQHAGMIVAQCQLFCEDNFASVFSVSALHQTNLDELKLCLYDHILRVDAT